MWWSLGNNMEKCGHIFILPMVPMEHTKASASRLCRKATVAARPPVSNKNPGGPSVFPTWCCMAAAECLLSLGVHSSPLTSESSRAWAPDVHVVLQVIPRQTKAHSRYLFPSRLQNSSIDKPTPFLSHDTPRQLTPRLLTSRFLLRQFHSLPMTVSFKALSALNNPHQHLFPCSPCHLLKTLFIFWNCNITCIYYI